MTKNSGNFTKIRILKHASITAHQIYIDSPNSIVEIDGQSWISTSGGSFSTDGTDKANIPLRGANMVGFGGYCDISADLGLATGPYDDEV